MIAGAALSLFGATVFLFTAIQRRRVRSQIRRFPLPEIIRQGEPSLLYFWTGNCSQCKPQVRFLEEAIAALHEHGHEINIHKFHALQEEELVNLLHIITVPTTVLVDAQGNIAAWNPGLTGAKKLIEQLLAVFEQIPIRGNRPPLS
jgi:thiol-disulfide isomerase/thioredoxin